jgi:hypothetical protein
VVARHGAITNGVTEAGCPSLPVRSGDDGQRGDGAWRVACLFGSDQGQRAGWRDQEVRPGCRRAGLARSPDDPRADRPEPGGWLEDLERLEQDAGFAQVMREVERRLLSRAERRALRARWRKPRTRALPSPSAMWLARFHDAAAGQPRPPGSAIIPAMAEPVRAL